MAEDMDGMAGTKKCVAFTFQFAGLGTRKTGLIFWVEALARKGYDTHVVTVQLSRLSQLAGVARLNHVPRGDYNRWRERMPRLKTFVWRPLIHPVRLPETLPRFLNNLLVRLYPRLLPRSVIEVVRDADLIIIESCAAVALFDVLKAVSPGARFMYCASDRLQAVGMNPSLTGVLVRTAPAYDLIRIPATSMAADFPSGSNIAVLRHGIEKEIFDAPAARVYPPGTINAVVAGDMNFDRAAVERLVEAFPDVHFHCFGRMKLGALSRLGNVHEYGEVPFVELVPYLKHADIGIAPYLDRPGLEYLSESSLKLLQYTYCRLPVVAPEFSRGERENVIGYDPMEPLTVVEAMTRALALDRSAIDIGVIDSWDDVVSRSLQLLNLEAPAASPPDARYPDAIGQMSKG